MLWNPGQSCSLILDSRYWIVVFVKAWILDSSFQSLVGFQIPLQLYSGLQSLGFRVLRAKISLIPDSGSGFSFMGREISRFTTFLSIRIVLCCFYVLVRYFEKFITWVWLLLFYVTLNLSTVFSCCIQSTTFRDTTRNQDSKDSNVQLAPYFRLAACFHDLPITTIREPGAGLSQIYLVEYIERNFYLSDMEYDESWIRPS